MQGLSHEKTTSSEIDHNLTINTHNLTTDIDHDVLTNTHNLSTDIDHNQLTNTHNLSTDIDHNSLTNTHNLNTDIDHDQLTNTHDLTTDIDHDQITNTHNLTTDIDHDQLTNFVLEEHIDWTDASSNFQTSGTVKIGNVVGGNYSEFESDGTFKMNGNATVWEDLRVPMNAVKVGADKPAEFRTMINGLKTFQFIKNEEQQVYFVAQLPHSYKEGTDVYPHVHWYPADISIGTVTWFLEYSWANQEATHSASTTISVNDVGDGTAFKHQFISLPAISGTAKTISSILVCRLYRNGGIGDDNYNDYAGLLEIDFHFQKDTVGSRQQLIK